MINITDVNNGAAAETSLSAGHGKEVIVKVYVKKARKKVSQGNEVKASKSISKYDNQCLKIRYGPSFNESNNRHDHVWLMLSAQISAETERLSHAKLTSVSASLLVAILETDPDLKRAWVSCWSCRDWGSKGAISECGRERKGTGLSVLFTPSRS